MSNAEADLALSQVQAAAYRKKINAGSWNDDYENLISQWGEKAAGLRFMHNNSSAHWRGISNNLALYSIVATTIASAASLVAGSIDDVGAKDAVLFTAGGIGLVTSFIQSLKKFYNADEKAAEHGAIAKQFGSFYRYVTMQMNMSREDRDPADILTAYALKEYERLQQEAPPLSGASITAFKAKFMNGEQAVPDVAEDKFVIHVTKPPGPPESEINVIKETIKINDVVVKPSVRDVEVGTSGVELAESFE